LAKRHGINPKTVAQMAEARFRRGSTDGPKEPNSTVLSLEEEAIIVAFRRTPCYRSMIVYMRCNRRSRT
jgi:hypothetical protein